MAQPAGPAPHHGGEHFECPYCDVDANHRWEGMKDARNNRDDPAITRSTCRTCGEPAYWVWDQLVWPRQHFGPQPSDDMPDDLRAIYDEARGVAPVSPRASAALLRLLIERLVTGLDSAGKPGDKLHDRVRRLEAAHELTRRTVAALDAVRWGGNDAVHEGRIDPDGTDDTAVVLLLFELVNRIVEDTRGIDQKLADYSASREAARQRAKDEATGAPHPGGGDAT